MKIFIKKNSGFMAVEILVAISIITVAILAATAVAQKSIALGRQALHTGQAAFLLEEGAEAVRTIRDNSWNNITSLTDPSTQVATLSNVDTTTAEGGTYTSLAIGIDGLPVISYEVGNYILKVVKCGNPACSSDNIVSPVGSTGFITGTSIAVGADGLPIISYGQTSQLKVLKCGNASCSSGNTVSNVDSTALNVGANSTIAIGSDGLPVIVYDNATNQDIKVAHCGNNACSSGNTITNIDTTGWVVDGYIVIGADGLPFISYVDETNNTLKVVKCGNLACSSGNTKTSIDTSISGRDSAVVIGADGLPVIVYDKNSTVTHRVVKCGNLACSSGNILTTVDTVVTGSSSDNSIALGLNGFPVIAYYTNDANADLRVLKCGNPACTSGNTKTSIDTNGAVGSYPSIKVASDGLAVISYKDNTNGYLKVAKYSTNLYPSFSAGAWTLSNTSNTVGIFTRIVNIVNVKRDNVTKDIATIGTEDPGTKLVTVTVSWAEGAVTLNKTLQFYITNLFL